MYQNSQHTNQDETRWVLNSKTNAETLGQQKSNSWTPMGPTKDRASSPDPLNWKFLGRSHHWDWSPIRRRAIKEDSKAANRDWVNHQACSLSHNIPVVSVFFYKANIFFLNLYTKSP